MIRRSELPLALGLLLSCDLAPTLRLQATGTANVPVNIPDDFPKDFPVYNATVKSYGPIVPANPALGNILVLQTFDTKASVLDFYRKVLPSEGWTLEKPFSEAPDSLTAYKETRRISVGVLASQVGAKNSTLIQLGVNGNP